MPGSLGLVGLTRHVMAASMRKLVKGPVIRHRHLPDLNPLNFVIWGYVKNKACSFLHPSVDALKASVEKK